MPFPLALFVKAYLRRLLYAVAVIVDVRRLSYSRVVEDVVGRRCICSSERVLDAWVPQRSDEKAGCFSLGNFFVAMFGRLVYAVGILLGSSLQFFVSGCSFPGCCVVDKLCFM